MTIKAREFDIIANKLELVTRNSGDRLAWFKYEGKTILRTRRSHKKGKDLPFQDSIRQQLKLNENELRQVIGCQISRKEYVDILKSKGLI
jgi:hypothetical protein